jgi:hypothetical protein
MLDRAVINQAFRRYWWLILCVVIAAAMYAGFGFTPGGQPVGAVIKVSGPLSVKKVNGSVSAVAAGAEIETGDTLMTGENSYALIRFVDQSEITLRPGTTFVITGSAAKKLARTSR